ncbi:MAG: aspartate kinase [Halobacteriaceae archaeon]
MRVVVKFGGTSLGNGDRVERAAASIAAAVEAGHEVVVVASAMGATTDELLEDITFEAADEDRAEIVSMGERTSVRMLKAALAAKGVSAEFIEPDGGRFPIVASERGEVDIDETRERTATLATTLGETVPVVTGFLAETPGGEVTTLGRGGSDTTAVLLGRELDADAVVIVTDVEGVMTGDPRVVEGARNVGEITVDELRNLSFRGAEVIAPSALAYKTADLEVRVIHYQHDDLLRGGTRVEGEFENIIDMRERPLACLTVAGRAIRNRDGILALLSETLADSDINIDAVASGMDSVTFYVDSEVAERAENVLHHAVIEDESLSSVTVSKPYAVVRVLGGELPNEAGVIRGIVVPLAEARINIHELITSATSVAVFVDWEDREETLEIIQDQFGERD